MILIEDTRQKESKHDNIKAYCDMNNIVIVQKVLQVGDYMLGEFKDYRYKETGNISVDTKADIGELANDLYRDKISFNKKYSKCYHNNIKLVVLVEEEIKSMKELLSWTSKHTKINGRMLYNMIHTLKVSYGIRFMFCDKKDTCKNIIRILNGEI